MKHGIESTLERTKEELQLAGCSPATVKTYHAAARWFLRHASKPSNRLTHRDVRDYMLDLAEAKYSSSTINQHHFATRFLFRDVLKKKACFRRRRAVLAASGALYPSGRDQPRSPPAAGQRSVEGVLRVWGESR